VRRHLLRTARQSGGATISTAREPGDTSALPDGSAVPAEEFLAAIVGSADEAIVGLAIDGTILSWNDAAERLYGYRASEVVGTSVISLMPDDREDELTVLLGRVQRWETVRSVETEQLRKSGTRARVAISLAPVRPRDGDAVGICMIVHDRTEGSLSGEVGTQAEPRAEQLTNWWEKLSSIAPIGLCLVDRDLRFVRVNEKAAAINGLPVADHIGRTLEEVVPQFWPQLEPAYRRVLATGELVTDVEVTNESAEEEGRVHSWLQSFYPVRDAGEVVGVGAVFSDVTDLKEAELAQQDLSLAIRYQSAHDPVTGLPNRTLLVERAERMLARARDEEVDVVAVVLDLDKFNDVSDALGAAAGDQLLVEVAQRLRHIARDTDTVGRLGSGEFVLLAEIRRPVGTAGPNGSAGAVLVGERVLSIFRDPFVIGDPPSACHVSAATGIASGAREHAEELLRDADIALYRAKAEATRGYVLFEGEMRDALRRNLDLGEDLRAALDRQEFALSYQPLVSISAGAVVGVEALLRWRHPERGLVAPADFLPLLEESGLIVDVGREVLRWACLEAVRWREAGFDLPVSVNVSARQLESRALRDDISAALSESGLDPQRLVIEISERALLHEPDVVMGRIAKLKALGLRVAVDGFGAGYSSLARMRGYPIDIVKIDPAFVSAITGSTGDQSLFNALVQLGNSLGFETVAEGIEEQDQLDRLRGGECGTGQGFLYAKPLEPEAFMSFLRRDLAHGTSTPAGQATAGSRHDRRSDDASTRA
jgi:diguanylate cyclase (GGDEF)-like protein/PAS domain S-box-containing protein